MGVDVSLALLDISAREKEHPKKLQTTNSFHMQCLWTSMASCTKLASNKNSTTPLSPSILLAGNTEK